MKLILNKKAMFNNKSTGFIASKHKIYYNVIDRRFCNIYHVYFLTICKYYIYDEKSRSILKEFMDAVSYEFQII